MKLVKEWAPVVIAVLMASLASGLMPRCGDYQTLTQAQAEHRAIRDEISANHLGVIKAIHQLESRLVQEIRDVERAGRPTVKPPGRRPRGGVPR